MAALKATNEDIEELEDIIEQIDIIKKNKKKTVPLDVRFHHTIAKATHNRVMQRTVYELRTLMHTWMEQNAHYVSNRDIDLLLIEHKEIIKAIRNKEVEEARSAMRNHLLASSKNLRLLLIDRQLKIQKY